MHLSREARSARRESFRNMSGAQKLSYIFDYYKVPIAISLAVFLVLGSALYRHFTRKEVLLYTAYINLSVGDRLDSVLTKEFVEALGKSARKNEVSVYRGLYLSNDASLVNHEYAYASRLKLLGAINAKQLDVVLMNQEAYDLFSHSGFLLDLAPLSREEPGVYRKLEPYLRTNTIVLEDNAIEYNLNEADQYRAVTEERQNGIELTDLPIFFATEFSGPVYLGVVANTPRILAARSFISYLLPVD